MIVNILFFCFMGHDRLTANQPTAQVHFVSICLQLLENSFASRDLSRDLKGNAASGQVQIMRCWWLEQKEVLKKTPSV
jgi:hypothetical protein